MKTRKLLSIIALSLLGGTFYIFVFWAMPLNTEVLFKERIINVALCHFIYFGLIGIALVVNQLIKEVQK